ncbi:HlyD family type I secretion periplasmic adaptor subunit [Spartinivicinus poritis]|uniref:Membrane fusion protein (MFP) family protein n=1 Tax=Spartinivicinus poritis TaxID=2994640 RepID=A0ABT5UB32_9GAMM|nr:HlyD family type I secretion periplasmic adaptor subunit [Spartinivicinus sp. A2-2]MDE1463594.1 HlyD family type I secretion periplasmic adaptor subunit [Spartinivicinus sp. A2-2]
MNKPAPKMQGQQAQKGRLKAAKARPKERAFKAKPADNMPSYDLDYMSDTSAAMMLKTPKGSRILLFTVLVVVIVLLIWSAWADIDEVTRGSGKVIPSTHLQVVQNLEGGILKELYVAEGDMVKKGQSLMQLDDTRFASSFRESEVEYFSLLASIARLKAEINETPLSFSNELDKFPEYKKREREIYKSRLQSMESELSIVKEQAEQVQQDLKSTQAQKKRLERSKRLLKREYEMTKPLARQGVVSEVEMIQLEQRLNDLDGELETSSLAIPKLESSFKEAKQQEQEVRLEFKEKAVAELKEAEVKLAQLKESRSSIEDQVQRTSVRSPVAGIVKKIDITTIGGVVQPGMNLVEIVPLEDTLLIEAKIRPKDIAFIRLGLKAVVKFTAYDFAIYGGLDGVVEHISADTIQDEEDESYYLVRIRTDESNLGSKEKPLPIIPGMLADVDIITGKKTVLDYLLKPILRAKQNALTER